MKQAVTRDERECGEGIVYMKQAVTRDEREHGENTKEKEYGKESNSKKNMDK